VSNAIERTAKNAGLVLNICFSYGGRDDIVVAVQKLVAEGLAADEVDEDAIGARLYTGGMPDPDLVIRTGGEMRVSNFLLWQCAYAELYFTDSYWPDFGREDIDIALAEYGRRKRRFGGLSDSDDRGGE
jgi:undecaprenyl diphosphate synthase